MQAVGAEVVAELARRLRLPASMLERIANRRIDPASIPAVFVRQMATALETSGDQVSRWLVGQSLGGGAMPAMVREEPSTYRASTTFTGAVDNFADFDEADRAYWQAVVKVAK